MIRSRTLRTWGDSESGLAEKLADHMEALDSAGPGAPTLAFLASGIEGLKVRITVKAPDEEAAARLIESEDRIVRDLIGDIVFGVDEETMEHAVAGLLRARGLTLAVAESLTGGLVASRLVDVPGASDWFRGGVVSYASDVKYRVLDVPAGPVVSAEAAAAMATGVRALLGADVGLAVTGVAGPDSQEGQPPGTVFMAVALPDRDPVTVMAGLPGDRARVRQFACISLLDLFRRALSRCGWAARGRRSAPDGGGARLGQGHPGAPGREPHRLARGIQVLRRRLQRRLRPAGVDDLPAGQHPGVALAHRLRLPDGHAELVRDVAAGVGRERHDHVLGRHLLAEGVDVGRARLAAGPPGPVPECSRPAPSPPRARTRC